MSGNLCTILDMAVNAERLRDRRAELDITNADVAARASMSRRYVENIMCGADHPSRRVVYRLARALQMDAADIDADITAGRRTPRGDPSEPPRQPPDKPNRRPPRRQDHEGDKKGPKRMQEAAS